MHTCINYTSGGAPWHPTRRWYTMMYLMAIESSPTKTKRKKGIPPQRGHRVNRCLSMMYLRVCVCVECVCPWQMVQMLPISHPSAAMTQLHHTNPVGERHCNHEDHQNISATSSGCKFQIVQWHVAASRPPQPPMVKNGAHLPESLQRK